MKALKYILASLLVHALLLSSVLLKWDFSNKQTYLDSEVLLMGENTGDKLTEDKTPKAVKKTAAPQTLTSDDPDALKVHDIQKDEATSQQASEGSFGQGGKVKLDYEEELLAWVTSKKRFPKLAGRLGQECDKVSVTYTIFPDGRLDDAVLTEKCEHDIINQAALAVIKEASPFKPFPESFAKTPQRVTAEFTYKLTQ